MVPGADQTIATAERHLRQSSVQIAERRDEGEGEGEGGREMRESGLKLGIPA